MAPKKTRPLPAMRDLSLAEQEERIDRYETRRDVRDANKELAAVLKAWVKDVVLDSERFEIFHAHGHQGEYRDEYPQDTLVRKLIDLGWTEAEIEQVSKSETPLDYMTADELGYVFERIKRMLAWFAAHPEGGTHDHACRIYLLIGKLVREVVAQQTGHAPEQFSTPHDKITGRERAARFQPAPYRAPLFPDEETTS